MRRGRIYRFYDNLQHDLEGGRMANPVDFPRKAAVPELPKDQPHQPTKQSHAENLTEQTEAASGEGHC